MALTPTPDQLDALRDFAKKNGKNWKIALHAAWLKASAPPLLQQLRNQFGPAWLARFREIKFEGRRLTWTQN